MAVYVHEDIKSTFAGDIQLDQKGDLAIADSKESHLSAANFILRTDRGDYLPNLNVGADLGTFIGRTNNVENHDEMEFKIYDSLTDQVWAPEDVKAIVVPFSTEEALCTIMLKGSFLLSGEIRTVHQETLVYNYPYIEGSVTPLTI